jgi:glycogen(starch) synthase
MRVLVVTNMYPPHHYGGYELSCQDTVERFVSAGHEVSVLTSDIRVAGVDEPDSAAAPVWRDLRLYWDDHELLNPSLTGRLAIERSNQRALQRALARARPHVVSVWNMGALSLGLLSTLRRCGLPVVYVVGDDWPVYGQVLDAWSRLYRRRVGRLAAPLVKVVAGVPTATIDFSRLGPFLFYSESVRQIVRESSGLSVPSSAVVHCGVDTRDFPLAAAESPAVARPWRGLLLYVGRIDERKGIDTAIRALSSLPGCRFRIVGRGDDSFRKFLAGLANEMGVSDRVEFATVARRDLAAEYRAADVLLFTSVYREPFGIVPLEAMACDTPVLGTGTGGSGEYLRDGVNCLLFRPGDPISLAAGVRRLAEDSALRGCLVAGGRETARRLTTDKFAEALLSRHLAVARPAD